MTRTSHVAVPTSVPLSLLDEHFLVLDEDREPWGIQIEVRVGGQLDPDRLADAIATAARRHPLARASLARWEPMDLAFRWAIADELDDVPLTVTACEDDAALGRARERLYGVSPSLHVAPPFTVVLAQCPGGDTILLNLHHAAGDGVGAVRLVRSILRAYAAAEDHVPPIDPLAVRDVRALAGARSLEERVARRRALARAATRRMAPVTRVARQGGDRRPGYGFELLAFSADESAAVFARRTAGTTVNDLLLAALAVAIRRWNTGHRRRTGLIALTMPVNLRPDAWRDEVLGNFASYVSILLDARDHEDLQRALKATAAHTRQIKRERLAGMVVDLLVGPSLLPVAAKRHLQDLIPMTGNVVVDTASLSNLGALDGWPALGAGAGAVESVWISPPGRAPLGAAIGVTTVGGRLNVAMRYPHTQFDAAGAAAFAGVYRDVLVG